MNMTEFKSVLVTLIVLFVVTIRCDYQCLCNYNQEKKMFESTSAQSQVVGYMYEFDCKPALGRLNGTITWIIIANEHKKAYVMKDGQTEIQACPGTVPAVDALPSTKIPVIASTLTTSAQVEPQTAEIKITQKVTQPPSTMSILRSTPRQTAPPIHLTTTTMPTTSTTTPPKAASQSTKAPAVFAALTSSAQTPIQTSYAFVGNTNSGNVVCPLAVQQSAMKENGILFVNRFDMSCYELVKLRRTWTEAEKDCQGKGGHLATIKDFRDQDIVQNHIKSQQYAVWIGLNDKQTEGNFEWSSGKPVEYQRWKVGLPHVQTTLDCITMDTQSGLWGEDNCYNLYNYVCEFGAIYGISSLPPSTPVPVVTDGNTHLCPSTILVDAIRNHGRLAQYGSYCYELLTNRKVIWSHAENLCKAHGGHLAHISSQTEQDFLQSFMNRHSPKNAVWIGLHDTLSEGKMEWTSGDAVSYTNWIPGHTGNHASPNTEDCVEFLPFQNGQWDDVPCGGSLLFLGDFGEKHEVLCQYKIGSSLLIG